MKEGKTKLEEITIYKIGEEITIDQNNIKCLVDLLYMAAKKEKAIKKAIMETAPMLFALEFEQDGGMEDILKLI